MINRLNLYDDQFNKIDMKSLGLFGVKLIIPSPSYEFHTEKIDGGQTIVLDKQLNPRQLFAEFKTKAGNYEELLKQKMRLFALLGNGDEFYIEQVHLKGIVWKCHLGEWDPQILSPKVTTFNIPLTNLNGYAESISTIKKTFKTTEFKFLNEGNVKIDPRQHSNLLITFAGASTDLTITNNTTGDTWKHYGTTNDIDTLKLLGVNSIKNQGTSIFKDTNKKLLTLNVGRNDFIVSGATGSFELEISTRFYFL